MIVIILIFFVSSTEGELRICLQRGQHWPISHQYKKEARYQLHYWATDTKYRAQFIFCQTCEVTLCLKCFKLFHIVEDLIGQKQQLQQQYPCEKLCMTWKMMKKTPNSTTHKKVNWWYIIIKTYL